MTDFALTALMRAGAIRQEEDMLGLIEGLELEQAKDIALWLAMSTQGDVALRHLTSEGAVNLELSLEQAREVLAVRRPPRRRV